MKSKKLKVDIRHRLLVEVGCEEDEITLTVSEKHPNDIEEGEEDITYDVAIDCHMQELQSVIKNRCADFGITLSDFIAMRDILSEVIHQITENEKRVK